MKTIALSQRVEVLTGRNEVRDAVDQRLVEFIAAAGGLAFPVPNVLFSSNRLDRWLDHLRPDAIVLSGGNTIGESPERDATELALLNYAEIQNLPVLGLCRGMQMIGHRAGVPLKRVNGHVGLKHPVIGEISARVNSYHDFALAECPPGFTVLAQSEDGELEAIRHSVLPWEGWMWHPEREHGFPANDVERLRRLIA